MDCTGKGLNGTALLFKALLITGHFRLLPNSRRKFTFSLKEVVAFDFIFRFRMVLVYPDFALECYRSCNVKYGACDTLAAFGCTPAVWIDVLLVLTANAQKKQPSFTQSDSLIGQNMSK